MVFFEVLDFFLIRKVFGKYFCFEEFVVFGGFFSGGISEWEVWFLKGSLKRVDLKMRF